MDGHAAPGPPQGLLAEWNFDEGRGDVAHDSSGHGHDATIHGATWVKQGDGFALNLDGLDDYVVCGKGSDIGVGGPATIEAWIRPTAKSQGLACLFGEGLKEYLVAYYTHAELVFFYVGGGGNKVYERVELREWNHVAATFDGTHLRLWLNGRLAATRESDFKELVSRGPFLIGTKGRPDLPKFKGLVDRLRVYNRALRDEEIAAHFEREAPAYGGDRVEQTALAPPSEPPPLPAPGDRTVGPLPGPIGPTPFDLAMGKSGGFALTIKGATFPFDSRISWPNGDFNRLAAGDDPGASGESAWAPRIRAAGKGRYTVDAAGAFYGLHREVNVFPTHVYVKDTYTNTTAEDLGLLIYNELGIERERVLESRLGGFERGGRLTKVFCPSVFVADKNTGIGFLPVDDVFVIQSVIYNEPAVMGIGTEKLALASGTSYTLEWAVYPTGSGDYYDFINTFRRVEGRIATVDGGLGFFTHGPKKRDQIPQKAFLEQRGLKYGLMHNLAGIMDDPQLSVQGIEFMDFPEERERLRKQVAEIHAQHPDLKVLVHIAHSLYCTDDTDRFADSKVILPNGQQNTWGVPHAYISKERQDKGWKFWVFYPAPGNRFHDAMMRSVDVLLDDIGMDGGFMDGFFAGYGGRWTYDGRWDGYSAEIDLRTKTIKRKLGSVLLLSQPSMIEYCRRIHAKGGTIVANNTVVTRSIANEKYIIHDSESGAGPQLHLAPTVTALANPVQHKTRQDMYRNMLENLEWGELFIYYGGHFDYAYRPLAARQFPMTFEEIRAGLVRGPERIVTMNSGIYGWPGERNLHLVHRYNAQGAPAQEHGITTVDRDAVRSELRFGAHESAVIEPIPVQWESTSPLNVRVLAYDATALRLSLHGLGDGMLKIAPGPLAIDEGETYRVTINGAETHATAQAGRLTIPLALRGETTVTVQPLSASR